MSSAVFISYRRDTAAGEARALFSDLVALLGRNAVFMDVDSISLGRDFRKELEKTLAACDLMLVLIDKDWAAAKDEKGQVRLENAGDFVRIEIETALKRDIRVTPVLVTGAQMPAAKELPAEIRDLAYRNGFELSHSRWDSDVREMIRRLGLDVPERGVQVEADPSALLEKRPAGKAPPVPNTRRLAGISVAIVAVLGLGYYALTHMPRSQVSPPQSQESPPQSQVSSPPCDLTGVWHTIEPGGVDYALTQIGNSVEFKYKTDTVNHFGGGIYDKDGRRVVLNLTRVRISDGCQLNGTSVITISSCNELWSETRWDAGCDLPEELHKGIGSRRKE